MKENFINYIPLKAYRYMRWKRAQDKIYRRTASHYGNHYAKLCYDAEKAIFLHRPVEETLAILKKRDDFILAHVETKCANVIKQASSYPTSSGAVQDSDRPIWVFWWTGEEDAPEIVKACIKSIRRNANKHDVIFLSRDNVFNYVEIPEWINQKHAHGEIGHAHYSDMIRLSLLAKYGGVWIDATVFLSQPLPENLFSADFYTAKSVDNNAFYFSRSRWVGYFLAGSCDFPLFSFVRDMLYEYWQDTDEIIAYLLMDYLFDIAYRNLPAVKNAMDVLPNNNLMRGKLMNELNAPYSQELFDALQTGETFLSKLSWRYGNPVVATKDGKQTNYGYLLTL